MIRLALAATALAIVAGCASTPPAPAPAPQAAADGTQQVAAANTNERKQVCVKEQAIGSLVTTTKCHYEDAEDGVRKAMDMDAFQSQVRQNTRSTVPQAPGSH